MSLIRLLFGSSQHLEMPLLGFCLLWCLGTDDTSSFIGIHLYEKEWVGLNESYCNSYNDRIECIK